MRCPYRRERERFRHLYRRCGSSPVSLRGHAAAMQPRLMMTAAMAFFSIALTLNLTGFSLANVHVTPLRLADLRPRAVRAYHGAATDDGIGADRALLRPSAVCVRSGIAGSRTARRKRGQQRKAAQARTSRSQERRNRIPGSKDGGLARGPSGEAGVSSNGAGDGIGK